VDDEDNVNGLDRDRVESLFCQIAVVIRENYLRGPASRDRVYESLNALAAAAAQIIKGCDDAEAYEWFERALTQQLCTSTISIR